MTIQWLLVGACAASALMAMARGSGGMPILGPADRRLGEIFDRDGDDRSDYRARASAIVAYLTARAKDGRS